MSAAAPDAAFDRALIATSVVVVLGAIMSILDTTIVNVAIDALAREFDASLTTIQWVATGYMLALGAVIPITGWIADRFGTKRLYLMSIGLFTAGSALCGLAWSAESLIGFRVLQGLGGGMIMPAAMTILTQAAGPQRVGRVMSVVGVPMMLGPILGPILGGWLIEDLSWRWIFFVNIPIGAIALPLALRILPADVTRASERLDLPGLLLLSPGLAALIYGLSESSAEGGFGATRVIVPIVGGALLVALFAWRALRAPQPLIDVRLLKDATVRASTLTMTLFAMAFFGTMLLIPLYYQVVRGQSALDAGLLMAPGGVAAGIMMPISGRIADRRSAGVTVVPGLVLIALGFLGWSQVAADTSLWQLGATQFLLGLGMGATMMPAISAAYKTLTRVQVARATTMLNVIQRTSGAIGTALLSVVLASELSDRVPRGGAEGGLGAAQSLPAGARERAAPTLAEAFGHTFWWAIALVALAAVPAFMLLRRPKPPPEEEPSVEAPASGEPAAAAQVV